MELDTHTIIVKVTNDCNLDCKYCFVEEAVPRNRIIPMETLELLFDELEVHASQPTVHLTWHGGEPMLAGIEFYKEVIDLQKTYKKSFVNAIQTNGTLINEEYASFFRDNSFLVGVSLDGPEHINDLVRVDKVGRGTFKRVTQNLQILRESEVNFGVLSTIARHNVSHAKEVYDLFQNRGLSASFSALYPSGHAVRNMKFLSVTPMEYADFLIEAMYLWMNSSQSTSLRSVELILKNMLSYGQSSKTCTFCENCHESFLALGPTGDLFPCCLFQGLEDFRYGNIHQISLSKIPSSTVWKKLKDRAKYIKTACSGCEIEEYCHGGCPFNSVASYGKLNKKDYYCSSHRKAFPAMLEMLENKVGGLIQ